ncbi:MAG: hypothetical protein EBV03_08110 [Proteobacteria bacterium]|nr:hypothetical protein [Pseudomonadota bacterium]
MKRFLLFLSLFALPVAGCRPLYLNTVDPTGPPEYQLGWEDGCDTGVSAEGEWYYKVMYGFKKRPEMAANDQYKQGWNEGFSFCRFSLAKSSQAGDWKDIGFGDGF